MSQAQTAGMAGQFTFRMDDELEEELDEYLDSFEFPPSKADVVRQALTEYLRENYENSEL